MQRRPALAFILPALLAGCVATGPAPSGARNATLPPTHATDPVATGALPTPPAETPTAAPTELDFDELPELRPELRSILLLCDPSPGTALTDPPDQLLVCGDGLELGLRAVQAATDEPIERAWLRLPTCSNPCTLTERSTGTLTAWTAAGTAWSSRLNAVTRKATLAAPDPTASWPSLDAPVPAVARPRIAGAPVELAERKPLPFCGHSVLNRPAGIPRCFLAAVLAGRPAEVIDTQFGTEGGKTLQVARSSGSGSIEAWHLDVDVNGRPTGWYHVPSALVLGSRAEDWSLVPFS